MSTIAISLTLFDAQKAKVAVENPGTGKDRFKPVCPCCKRDFITDESSPGFTEDVQLFMDTLEELGSASSPLLRTDPREAQGKEQYENWRKLVSECMDDARDYRRVSKELSDVESEHSRLSDDFRRRQTALKQQREEKDDLGRTEDELRELADVAKRWLGEAQRIADKHIQIGQQQLDLTATLGDCSRDIKDVERDLNRKMADKDDLGDKINELNKEMTQLNQVISDLSGKAMRMDQLAREKEEKFAADRKNLERKEELSELINQITREEKGVSTDV